MSRSRFPPVKPKRLRRGDLIGLICPASAPVSEDRIHRGARYLESLGYRVAPGTWVRARHGDFAGTDAQRVDDLNAMLRNPEIRAILAVRGGYGCLRFLDRVDYAAARRDPKILVGYSDLTSLQLALWRRAGWITFSGPMSGVEFWQDPDPFTEEHFWRALTSTRSLGSLPMPEGMQPGIRSPGLGEGPLLGGCLSLVVSSLGTPYSPNYRNALLALEDVHEEPYRLDRMLTQLRLAGVLRSISGLLLGQFSECRAVDEKKPHLRFPEILDEVLAPTRQRKIPVLENLPYGHVPVKWTLPWGVRARLDAVRSEIRILESAVAP